MRQHYFFLPRGTNKSTSGASSKSISVTTWLYAICCCMLVLPAQRVSAQNNLDNAGLSSTQALAAYSVRKLSSTYTSISPAYPSPNGTGGYIATVVNTAALRVRRSSDNAQQDIGFTISGDLNQAALLAFVGVSTGYVVTWYDQSGGGRNATQSNVANQPMIVNAGVLLTSGGRAALKFNGGFQNLNYTIPGTVNYPITISLLANTGGASTYGAFVKMGSDAANPGIGIGVGNGNLLTAGTSVIGLKDNGYAPGIVIPSTVSYPSAAFVSTTSLSSNLNLVPLSSYLNGLSVPLSNNTSPTKGAIKGSLFIGGYNGTSTGNYTTNSPVVSESEVIIFNAILTTSTRETLECSQFLYYNILISSTGSNQKICGSLNSLALGGNTPTYGTGRWVQVSGPGTTTFSSDIDPNSTATASQMGTYVYSWEVSNGSCIAASSITVSYSISPTVGINQNICGLPRISNPLGGNSPAVGTGLWSKISGPGNVIAFSDINDGNSTVEVDADGTYIFRWTVAGDYCSPNYADVTVTFNAISGTRPTAVLSGSAAICPGSSTNLTVNFTGTAPWNFTYTNGTNSYNLTAASSPFSFPVTPAQASTYTISALTDAACISQGPDLTGSAVITFSPSVNITADYCSLGNGLVKLDAGAHYSWLWSNGATTRTINVAQSGFYSVTVRDVSGGCAATGSYNVGQELVFNGDFSLGNVGFVTQYQVPTIPLSGCNTATGLYPEGKFDIRNNALLTHCNFFGRDHTQGTGTGNANFMIVNGAQYLQQIWRTNNIQVQPNTRYYFSAWALSLNNTPPFAALVFEINGVQAGSTATLAAGVNHATNNTGWTRFYGQWDSGPNTSVTIAITNTNLTPSGNDFGLDDISFSTIPPVTFSANPLANGGNSFCPNDTLVLTPNLTGGVSPFTYSWTGPGSYTSTDEIPVIFLANAAQAGVYTLTATDDNGCVATSSVTVSSGTPTLTSVSQPAICSGSTVSFNLSGMVANSINNTIYYKINNGVTKTVTGVNANASGNASFTLTGLTSANNGQPFVVTDVFNGSCTQSFTGISLTLNILATGTWIGPAAGNWNVTANWCGGIPTNSTNVIVPAGVTITVPIGYTATVKDLTVNGTLILNSKIRLYATHTVTAGGSFNATNGTIEMIGTVAQTISGNAFVGNTVKSLVISNTAGVTASSVANNLLNILDTLSFGAVSNTVFNTGDNVVLKSTATSTARVTDITLNSTRTGNSISGKVTVERNFPARRSWRLLTSPLSNTGSIFDNWQIGGTYVPGRGMFITGPNPTGSTGNGLDYSFQNNYSMQGFNNVTNFYIGVSNSKTTNLSNNTATAANLGYFAFVRGDRLRSPDNTVFPNVNTTTLSSKGFLQTGTQTFNVGVLPPGTFALIGNPYASSIDFTKIGMMNMNPKRFWAYDPSLGTLGLFVLMEEYPFGSGSGVFKSTNQPTSTQDKFIQSSQAFFVEGDASGLAGQVIFHETDKANYFNANLFRPATPTSQRGSLGINLLQSNADNTALLVDADMVEFDVNFNDKVDIQDALKLTNITENLALMRNSKALSVERRPLITANDTIFLRLTKTTQRSYRFEFAPTNLDPLLTAILEDSYTGTKMPLSVTSKSIRDFAVDGNAGSAVANRFRIVFKQIAAGPLPVTYKSIKAYQQAANIAVDWTVENELNISKYEVEKSIDAVNYTKVNTTAAIGANRTTTDYKWIDQNPVNGNNYYRIRSVDADGKFEYTRVVIVKITEAGAGIRIYPNPVTDNIIGVEFKNMAAGVYEIKLLNAAGQLMFTDRISHANGSSIETIVPGVKLASGIYELKVIAPGKQNKNMKVIVL